MIEIVEDPIDTDAVLRSVHSHQAGAALLFVGTTREFTDGRQTQSLTYECYPEMAIRKMEELRDEAMQRWPLVAVSFVGGMSATFVVVAIAYYGTIAAVRAGLDPDNHGIPIVTSAVDLVGAWALVLAVSALT